MLKLTVLHMNYFTVKNKILVFQFFSFGLDNTDYISSVKILFYPPEKKKKHKNLKIAKIFHLLKSL